MTLLQTFQNYASFCATTAIYPREVEVEYLALGLASEAGELLDAMLRRQPSKDAMRKALVSEASDCCWYVARLCEPTGLSFSEVAEAVASEDPSYLPIPSVAATRMAASAGLIAGKVKKQIRDGAAWTGEQREDHRAHLRTLLTRMIFDIHVFAVSLGRQYNDPSISLRGLCEFNTTKLTGRKERGTLGGSGELR